MNKFVKETIFHCLKNSIFSMVLYVLVFSLLYTFGGFLFFDNGRIEAFYGDRYQIPGWDYYILNSIGIDGVAKQGYFFTYIFLVILLITMLILDSYISYKKDVDVISLLKVKGYSFANSNGLFWLIKSGMFLISSIVAIILFLFISVIINFSLGTQIPILIFNVNIIIELLILNFIYLIINFLFYTIPYNEKELIKTIRNFY